ncbi:MAG: DUF4406 domain-containing protein [Aquihabitans sp.]
MTRIYVAGPMTGLPDSNYPAFRTAAAQLATAGYDVEDPSTNTNPTPDDYHAWLRAGLAQLITCEGVALLDGWEASGGARLEVNIAATLGMRVRHLHDWLNEAALLALADKIGDRIARGDLPAQDDAGHYILSHRDLDFTS